MDIVDYYCVMGGSAELLTNLGLVETGGSLLGGAGNGGDGGGDGVGGRGDCGEADKGGGGALLSFGRMKICGGTFDTVFPLALSSLTIKLSCSSYSLTML